MPLEHQSAMLRNLSMNVLSFSFLLLQKGEFELRFLYCLQRNESETASQGWPMCWQSQQEASWTIRKLPSWGCQWI